MSPAAPCGLQAARYAPAAGNPIPADFYFIAALYITFWRRSLQWTVRLSRPSLRGELDGTAAFIGAAPRGTDVAGGEYSPADRRGHSSIQRSPTL